MAARDGMVETRGAGHIFTHLGLCLGVAVVV